MKTLLLILLSFIGISSLAQKNKPFVIDVKEFEPTEKIQLPFSAIKVIDARFDRSNIGCIRTLDIGIVMKSRKIAAIFPDSLHSHLSQILPKFVSLDKASIDTLVILIKQFRIADYLFDPTALQYNPTFSLRLSASFFRLQKNELIKLSSVDDLYSKRWVDDLVNIDYKNHEYYRINSLMNTLYKLFSQIKWIANNSSGVAPSVLTAAIMKRFELPLFTDSVLKVGLYKTFKEFKQNQPSNTSVKMRFSNQDVFFSAKDSSGKSIDIANYWGACDGKNRYIVFRSHLHKLSQSDKSFNFFSYTTVTDLYKARGHKAYAKKRTIESAITDPIDFSKNYEYLYLNMDDEEIYLEEIFGNSGLKNMQKEILK